MGAMALSTQTDTAAALSLRAYSSPTTSSVITPETSVNDSSTGRVNRFPINIPSDADAQLGLRQQRRFYPQNDLNFKTRHALSEYHFAQDAPQLDELSRLMGVSVYV